MPCQIRWVDMDAYKHVNNTAYLRYIEEARIRMFGVADREGFAWEPSRIVIAGLDIDYRRPLTFRPEPIQVVSCVTRVGRSSFDLAQRVVDGAVVHATATATIVAVGGAFGGPRPLDDVERAWLAAHAADPPARHRPVRPAARNAALDAGPARHEVDLALRWADMDVNGHVNNVAYALYMQEARAHLFALHDSTPSGGPASAAGSGRAPLVRGLVVVRMHVDFVRPLAYGAQPVRARTWFSSVGAATVVVDSEVRDAEQLYCRGRTTLGLFDFENDRPRRITPAEREALLPYLVQPQTVAAG